MRALVSLQTPDNERGAFGILDRALDARIGAGFFDEWSLERFFTRCRCRVVVAAGSGHDRQRGNGCNGALQALVHATIELAATGE